MACVDWIDGINVDDELIAVRDDVSVAWEIRVLAGASIGIDPVSGYAIVGELAAAVEAMIARDRTGRIALARILGRDTTDYARCLWYTLAGRHPLIVVSALDELRDLMKARAVLWCAADRVGKRASKETDPYYASGPEGPLGRFDGEFALGSHWDPYMVD